MKMKMKILLQEVQNVHHCNYLAAIDICIISFKDHRNQFRMKNKHSYKAFFFHQVTWYKQTFLTYPHYV